MILLKGHIPLFFESIRKIYGKPFILKDVKFSKNYYILFTSSFPALNNLADLMTKCPKLSILIIGFGSYRLGQKRADVIKDYLVIKRGIDRNRIKTAGIGEEKSIDPCLDSLENYDDEKLDNNRRIEIRFEHVK